MLYWLLVILVPGFFIGVGTVAAVIISLFASWGRRPSSFTLRGALTLCSPDFYRTLAAHCNTELEQGGLVTVLNNGDEIFPAMLSAIRNAKKSVHVMLFIWNDGVLSDMWIDALTERANAGVEVRVLIDSLGGMRAPAKKFRPLEAAGAQVAWYRRIEFGKLLRFHRRNHRRSIVIDGTTAFTGGMSISDEWLGNAQSPKHWRDMMVQVGGLMAQRLQDAFVLSWHAVSGEVLAGEKYFPVPPVEHDLRFMSVVSSPSDESHPLRTLFWTSLAVAKKSIVIANAYFVPDEIIRSVLKERARGGISVRVLVPSTHNDIPPVQWAGRYYYAELLEAGVRIAEYQPTMLHSKYIVVDGTWSLVGSANVDVRSKELNEENVLAVEDHVLAADLATSFEEDWTKAVVMEPASWTHRPFEWKVKEILAAMFTEQF